MKQAVAKLSPYELNRLVGEAPSFWKDEDDTIEKSFSGAMHREFGQQYDTLPEFKQETLLAFVRKLDRHALALSGMAVVMASAEARSLLMAGPIPQEAGTTATPGVDGGAQVFPQAHHADGAGECHAD